MRYFELLSETKRSRELSPQMIEQIRAAREEIRQAEGGGGYCHFVSEWIANTYGYDYAGGTVVDRNGDVVCAAHRWNIMPDGSILDATHDQFGWGPDIVVAKPGTPLFKHYRLEWDVDYNPSLADQYPELKDARWNGEHDFDAQNRLTKERGKNWHVTDPDQLARYQAQQRSYKEDYEKRVRK